MYGIRGSLSCEPQMLADKEMLKMRCTNMKLLSTLADTVANTAVAHFLHVSINMVDNS